MDRLLIRDMLAELASTVRDIDREHTLHIHRAASIIEDIAFDKAQRIVNGAGEKAVLQVFMSDGWCSDVRSTDVSLNGVVRITRTCRLRTAFVLQRVIVKCRVGDDVHQAIKIQRPRCLGAKKCIDLWSAAFDFQPMFKLMGHKGVSISLHL